MTWLAASTPAPAVPTDLWGVVVPGYIAAIGGLISAIVGAVALVQSIRARGGVRSLAAGLNAEQRAPGPENAIPLDSNDTTHPSTPSSQDPVAWSITKARGDQYRLTNLSRTVTATLTAIEEVSEGDDLTLAPDVHFPVEVPPQAPIPFYLARTFTSPSVTALRIEWTEPGRGPQSVTLYE